MTNTKEWAKRTLDRIIAKVAIENQRTGNKIPYIPINKRYTDCGAEDISWWTNGFWGGILWQAYHHSKDEAFKRNAEKLEENLDRAFSEFEGVHHDVGFMWLHTSVANYRQFGEKESYTRSLHAATILAGRFNLAGQFLRCWNDDMVGWVIIDSMMNIPLLHWAAKETKDPRFAQIAVAHATTVAKHLVREDGSVNHIGIFEPTTGEFLNSRGGQGYDSTSSWSRGQAWAVYGFALSYRHTKNSADLATAKKVAHYVISQLERTNFIAEIDYRGPAIDNNRDSSASAITACGLLEITKYTCGVEKDFFYNTAVKILQAISESADWDYDSDGIVTQGAVDYYDPLGHNVSLIYADYFFIEGISRLVENELDLW